MRVVSNYSSSAGREGEVGVVDLDALDSDFSDFVGGACAGSFELVASRTLRGRRSIFAGPRRRHGAAACFRFELFV